MPAANMLKLCTDAMLEYRWQSAYKRFQVGKRSMEKIQAEIDRRRETKKRKVSTNRDTNKCSG